jgi:hypothetical protein
MGGQRVHPSTFEVPAHGTQLVDMTGHGDSLRSLEIHTDAGIVRVNTNLEDTRTRVPVVVIEVEPKTDAGGHWVTSVRDRITRTDIRLTKDG